MAGALVFDTKIIELSDSDSLSVLALFLHFTYYSAINVEVVWFVDRYGNYLCSYADLHYVTLSWRMTILANFEFVSVTL